MTATLANFGLDQLPAADRMALLQQLWDSLEKESDDSALTLAQREELERRIADDDANPEDVVPWEEVKAEALARWAR